MNDEQIDILRADAFLRTIGSNTPMTDALREAIDNGSAAEAEMTSLARQLECEHDEVRQAFDNAMKDMKEGRTVSLDKALTEEPPFSYKEAHDMQQKLVISYVLENEKLREAIKNFYEVKGRYNSQIAAAKMFELAGLPTQYPKNCKLD